MTGGFRRRMSDMACRAAHAALPVSLRPWAHAVRCETASIPDDTKALMFALGSLFGLTSHAIASRLLAQFTAKRGHQLGFSSPSAKPEFVDVAMRSPRFLGIACAVGAVLLGIGYMAMAGAPARYLMINGGALIVGLAMLACFSRTETDSGQSASAGITAIAGLLLATALLGDSAEGATRWFRLGGLSIQPSLILLPVMIAAFARTRNALSTVSVAAAGAALAIMPDRAMAGMLVSGLAMLAIVRPDKSVIVALAASVVSFAVTLARTDALPSAPYVDRILYSSFDVHAAAGVAVLVGSALLIVPAIVGWSRDPANRAAYTVFGAVWTAVVVAAALGNYPTPLVGYGGSAIVGYALSLLALPRLSGTWSTTRSDAPQGVTVNPIDRHLLVGLA